MTFIRRMVRSTPIMLLAISPFGQMAYATPKSNVGTSPNTSAAASAAPASAETRSTKEPAEPSAQPVLEEQLRQQAALLEEMRNLLVKQQAEIDKLKDEVAAGRPSAKPVEAIGPHTVAPSNTTAASSAEPQTDELAKKVDELNRRFGRFNLSGDLRFRYEGFFNQGFDGANDVNPRNRVRLRARAQLAGEINKNFDWAIRLSTGGFNDPISTNQTLSEYFDRKPLEIDRAFLHFVSRSNPVDVEVFAGKFEAPWLKTFLTYDADFQPEGASESLKFNIKKSKLRSVRLTAWQLPFRERSVGADGAILGGQVLTDWKWSTNWSSSLAVAFNDFEQVDLIAPVFNSGASTVNSGLDYGSTNTIVINPVTKAPEFRSNFRVVDSIAEVRYAGFSERWPLVLRAEWIRNTSAFNNQKDGGLATIEIGRRQEKGDWFFAYDLMKTEREANLSAFMESDLLQTNSLANRITVSYSYLRNVRFEAQYIVNRRLQTTAPENRWLNRLQLDLMYRF